MPVFEGRMEITTEGSVRPRIDPKTKIILDPFDAEGGTVVELLDKKNVTSIRLDAANHSIRLYDGKSSDTSVAKIDTDKKEGARLILGGGTGVRKKSGFLTLLNGEGNRSVIIDGSRGKMVTQYFNGKESINIDGSLGIISVQNWTGTRTMTLSSLFPPYSMLVLGGGSAAGLIYIKDFAGKKSINMDGGGGSISLCDRAGNDSIIIDGAQGDIILNNADCAEDFDISNSEDIEAGTVMVIEREGKLQRSNAPYDRRVAGVISGAGDYKPGLVLDKKQSVETRKSISLVGKVYCKVDAEPSPIEVGDLLTTSSTPGHAMKAAEPLKAFGAIIGKALSGLKSGKGLIPILIALQ